MKKTIMAVIALVCGVCTWAGNLAQAEEAERDAQIAKAELAIGEFQKALKRELMTAIAEKGAAAAIHVCNEKAPAIARELSSQHELGLRRTSLRWRNPANEPTAEEMVALLEFERKKNEGVELSSLNTTILTQEGLRHLMAIPMKGMCAVCHGTNVDPKLYQTIKSYYPDDKATGFKEGDIRGAFSILLAYGAAAKP